MIQEMKAKKIADTRRFLCRSYKGHLSGELIRKLFSPSHRNRTFECPNCAEILVSKDLVEISPY